MLAARRRWNVARAARTALNYGNQIYRFGRGVQTAYRAYRGTRTSRRTLTNPYSGMSSHGQTKTVYKSKKRKRVNKRSKRRFKIFAKKVRKVLNGKTSMCTFKETGDYDEPYYIEVTGTSTGLDTTKDINSGNQLVMGNYHLYGLNLGGASNGPYEIITNYLANSYSINDDGTVGLNNGTQTATNQKFLFKNSRLKITITNQTQTSGDLRGLDLICDIYEFVAAKNMDASDHNTPVETWHNLLSTAASESAAAQYYTDTINTAGNTPLDCPGFGSVWKLLNKQRVVVPWNSDAAVNPETVIEMKSSKPFVTTRNEIVDTDLLKGKTKFLMIILKPDFSNNNYSYYTVNDPIARLYFEKTYHYKALPSGNTNVNPGYKPRFDHKRFSSPSSASTNL